MKSKPTNTMNSNNEKGIQMSRITGILIVIGTMALVLMAVLTLCGNQIDCMANQINKRIDAVENRYDANLLRVEEIQKNHIEKITMLSVKIDTLQKTLDRIEKKL